MKLWVIGAGGLFGSALMRIAPNSGWTTFPSAPIPWGNADETIRAITSERERFSKMLDPRERWAIIWAAGKATTTSSLIEADSELAVFERSLEVLRELFSLNPGGQFLLASSAGGIYAGSNNPPFDSSTEARPLGTYGRLKLDQELAARKLASYASTVILARIANLYGPGQDLSKLQGLISRLALASITKRPITMFVPLDTLRDFIHVDDAARSALHWISESAQGTHVRVIASGRAVTLGYVIHQMKDITKVQIPVAYGSHPTAAAQTYDLRLLSDTDLHLQSLPETPLQVGMRGVYDDLLLRHQQG